MVSVISKSPPALSVVAGPAPHTTTLVLDGEFDLACAAQLRAALDEQLHDGRTHIRVDVARVRFLDATVLGVLFSAHRQLLARGGTLVLAGAPVRVRRLLGITGLDRVLFHADPSSREHRNAARTSRPAGAGRLRRLRPVLPTS